MNGAWTQICNVGFLDMWIRVSTPLIFAALGAAICSRAGVVNLGLEGIMLLAALFGVLGGHLGGNVFWGMLSGVFVSVAISLVFAYFHLILQSNNVLCGTAVNTIASGLSVFVLKFVTGDAGTSASLKSYSFPSVRIPVVERIPVVGQIISGQNLLIYLSVLAVFGVAYLLYRTPLGLRIRSVGENPDAAASVGINVIRTRCIAIILCGVLTGFGGMDLSMGYLNMFTKDMTAGRGFIALAASSMGHDTPFGAFFSAILFSFFDALSNVLQTLRVPTQFVQMLPYLATILGLVFYSMTLIKRNKKQIRLSRKKVA